MIASSSIFKPVVNEQVDISAVLSRWDEMVRSCRDDNPELATALADLLHGAQGDFLRAIFAGSPFLSELLLSDPFFTRRVLCEDRGLLYHEIVQTMLMNCEQPGVTQKEVMRLLRQARRRVALVCACADLSGEWGLERVTQALSDFAEQTVRIACRFLLREACQRGKLKLPDLDDPETGSGLIVLGMGKLGAGELNYSSDIDLIILFDENRAPVDDPYEMPQIFVRIARQLTRMLDERTADGYVFRTDLRLRPDPGATPLAVSYGAAEIYYGSVGQNWERAAMIKARQIAGDRKSGADFLSMIRAWVFRRNLDFAALQDIHAIKRRINTHKLSQDRDHLAGRDIKLAQGGIREVEFFVQTQQLIYGGRDPRLRTPKTLDALEALVQAGHVQRQTADDLRSAYVFLRIVEHRLQMVADQQTHRLPKDDDAMQRFARFMGCADWGGLANLLERHMGHVSHHYGVLFLHDPGEEDAASPLDFSGVDPVPETLKALADMGFANPEHIESRIRTWFSGRARATRSDRARRLLRQLTMPLLRALAQTPVPDEAFARFDGFLEALPAGVQLFSLFYQNPSLMTLVAEIMGLAPKMAERLKSRPYLLDGVLSQDFFGPLPTAKDLRSELELLLQSSARHYEDVLDIIRRWAGDKRFHAGIHVLKGLTSAEQCGPFLSDVAEISVTSLLPYVVDDFARRHGRFASGGLALVALGRFGSRQMAVDSDLDLIMVYQPASNEGQSDGERPLGPSQYYIRLTQRLLSAINAPTAGGKLYEVDLRLRPAGAAGPIAVSIDSFKNYEQDDAWVWEHMALTRARVIAGPENLRKRLKDIIHDVLTMKRDAKRLRQEIVEMRARIEREFGTKNPWLVKYRRGGLVDADFIIQYLMLLHGHDRPGVLKRNMNDALSALVEHGVLEASIADDLSELLCLARRIQNFLRLTRGDDTFDPDQASPAFLDALASAALRPDRPTRKNKKSKPSFAMLEQRLNQLCERVFQHYQAILGGEACREG